MPRLTLLLRCAALLLAAAVFTGCVFDEAAYSVSVGTVFVDDHHHHHRHHRDHRGYYTTYRERHVVYRDPPVRHHRPHREIVYIEDDCHPAPRWVYVDPPHRGIPLRADRDMIYDTRPRDCDE